MASSKARETSLAEGWHHQDILAAVRKTGTSLRQLSVSAGFAASTLQASLYKRHPAAHTVIAKAVGVHRSVIWPRWYDEADRLRPLTPFAKRRLARPARSAA